MTSRADVVAALDKARLGDGEDLAVILYAFSKGYGRDKDVIVQDAMVAISHKLRAGATSVSLAPMLGGFLKNCRKRFIEDELLHKGRLAITIDQLQNDFADEMSDPAIRTARIETVDARIRMLADLKEKNPRQFATLEAELHEIPAVEYLEKKFGEVVSPENSRKLRERAKKTLTKGMQEIQKDSSS